MVSSLRTALLAALTALASVFALSGCVEADAQLDAQGGGTLRLVLAKLDADSDKWMRSQMTSPAVQLVESNLANGVGTYVVKFADARKLRTAALFRRMRIDHTGLDQTRRTISVSIPRRPRETDEPHLPAADYVVIDLSVTFPGTIVETTGERTADRTASWKLVTADLLGTGSLSMRTVYEVAAAQ